MNTEYEDLLREIMENGDRRGDRTGTGTRSLFGKQMRFNLSEGFPLITSKKIPFRLVVEELLWFLRGSHDVNELIEKNVHIWDEWRTPYTSRREWVGAPHVGVSKRRLDHAPDLSQADSDNRLDAVWIDMIGKVFDPDNPDYDQYGRVGITVDDRWGDIENFRSDARKVPQFFYWENDRDDDFVLTPFYFTDGHFGPETSAWVTLEEDGLYALGSLYRKSLIPDGEMGPIYGSQWRSWGGIDGSGPDQIKDVIESIKRTPESRRHIVSAWNVAEIDNMALPPCHVMFQFYVGSDNRLSCQMYQRSADMFLGVPFNIASYALLTHIIAEETGLGVGEFIWTGGDCHIYDNHTAQVEEQLTREPRRFPQIDIDRRDIEDYRAEDFTLIGYDPHPVIKADIAV